VPSLSRGKSWQALFGGYLTLTHAHAYNSPVIACNVDVLCVYNSFVMCPCDRYVHTRLRIHAESIAFFGGDDLEGAVCHEAFKRLATHDHAVASASWRYEILNDFVIQRFPPIVTWALSFLYTQRQVDIGLDRGGQLSHDLRYVSATVSHTFSSFGELLELQKRLAELSG
jgi:ABC-type uncharacterized transport system fused permease/ATPase subunit